MTSHVAAGSRVKPPSTSITATNWPRVINERPSVSSMDGVSAARTRALVVSTAAVANERPTKPAQASSAPVAVTRAVEPPAAAFSNAAVTTSV